MGRNLRRQQKTAAVSRNNEEKAGASSSSSSFGNIGKTICLFAFCGATIKQLSKNPEISLRAATQIQETVLDNEAFQNKHLPEQQKRNNGGDAEHCQQPRPKPYHFNDKILTVGHKNCSVGWGPVPSGTVHFGQNLEDAVIYNRFFSGNSPLAHLGEYWNNFNSDGGGNIHANGERGVFLEMGALDGVTFTNTLAFEQCLGWNGILIEAQPANVVKLKENRPCAAIVPEGICALSGNGQPGTLRMSGIAGVAFDVSTRTNQGAGDTIEVPCRSLSTVLKELGVDRINFFSLDVEGAELKVLETFDFKAVKIDVLMVEAEMISKAVGQVDSSMKEKINKVRKLISERSNLLRVPSRLDGGETDERLCERHNSFVIGCLFLSIAGSDVFVSPELYHYDMQPWLYAKKVE